ncbi:MAG: hypothetical protein V1869_04760 [Candidatus Omnitrophota bacterium]
MMIKRELEIRDILLFLIAIMLVINTFINLQPKMVEAETFRLDDCITSKPDDKPAAYLHVVTH